MFTPTLEQQEYIDNHADKIEEMAKGFWEVVRNQEKDPYLPIWEYLDAKDEYIAAASYILIVNEVGIL